MTWLMARGYEHVQALCVRCSKWRRMHLSDLTVSPGPINLATLNFDQLAERLRCKKCGGKLREAKPWRL